MIPSSLSIMGGDIDPYFSSVSSLLHFDGADTSTSFLDGSGKTWTAGGDAQIDTAQSKFGGASGLFDGATDFITTPDSADFKVGSGDFTIECWMRAPTSGNGADRVLWSKRASTSHYGHAFIYLSSSNKYGLLAASNSSTWGINMVSAAGITNDSWVHIALVRYGNLWTVYADGVAVISTTVSLTVYDDTSLMAIGAGTSIGDTSMNGHIDDFRFTKGVARYTAAFTPPSLPFPDR